MQVLGLSITKKSLIYILVIKQPAKGYIRLINNLLLKANRRLL
jgi:hypothetical protein